MAYFNAWRLNKHLRLFCLGGYILNLYQLAFTDKTNVEDVMKEIIAEDFDDPLVSIEVMHDKLKLKNK